MKLTYLSGYSAELQQKVIQLIENKKLDAFLLKHYPNSHNIRTDKALYQYASALKNQFIRNSAPLAKVRYNSKINVIQHALGLHYHISRIQGSKLKAKNEIQIAALFKDAPEPFLRMIVVHELAHLKEKEHDKAFYQLCCYIEPAYHQLEFDARLYLTYLELFGPLYK